MYSFELCLYVCCHLSYYRTFDNNMAYYAKCESKGRDFSRIGNKNVTSAVFAEIPIELRGNTIFSNNTGGGITIVVGRINIHGNITFENNCSPYDGGGINLQDESFVSTLIKIYIHT